MLVHSTGLLVESGEVDRHGLVGCPDIDLRRSVHLPPEEFEEANIGHLDMRLHGRAASGCRSADCQLHEIYPNMRGPVLTEHREPVALPEPCRVDGVEAHRPNDPTARISNEVHGRWIVVAVIEVVNLEQTLIAYEYRVPHREVALQIARSTGGSHRDVRSREIGGGAHEVGRGPICSGTVLGASGSRDFRPEHAWHRAQPAFAVPEFIPRRVMYAWILR